MPAALFVYSYLRVILSFTRLCVYKAVSSVLFYLLIFSGLISSGYSIATEKSSVIAASESNTVVIMVPPDDLVGYRQLLNGRLVTAVNDYGGTHSRRNVVELVLVMQALLNAEPDLPISFAVEENYQRIIRSVSNGTVTLAGTSIWTDDTKEYRKNLYISQAIIDDGGFVVGIYQNSLSEPLNIASTDDFRQLTAVSNRNWPVDWALLKKLPLRELEHSRNWDLMAKMVLKGRADFLLAPLSNASDMSITVDDGTLIPVDGALVVLPGSRHIAVSRLHPLGDMAYSMLELGLHALHEKGSVRKAYEQSGFMNVKASAWKKIKID